MAELVRTTDDLRRAYLQELVLENSFVGTAWHAIVWTERLVNAANIEFWSVTP